MKKVREKMEIKKSQNFEVLKLWFAFCFIA